MRPLHAGVDTTVVALWLGHERVDTTNVYIHSDFTFKERALARTTPAGLRAARYRPPDRLLAFPKASDYVDALGAGIACNGGACAHIAIIRTSKYWNCQRCTTPSEP